MSGELYHSVYFAVTRTLADQHLRDFECTMESSDQAKVSRDAEVFGKSRRDEIFVVFRTSLSPKLLEERHRCSATHKWARKIHLVLQVSIDISSLRDWPILL